MIANIGSYSKAAWKNTLDNSDLTLWDFILEANIDDAWCDVEGEIKSWVLSFLTKTEASVVCVTRG